MQKLNRNVFIYSEPNKSDDTKDFAQCVSCEHFIRPRKLCFLMSVNDTVYDGSSCNEYAEGRPSTDINAQPTNAYKPEEIGLVHRPVRCANCKFFRTDEPNEGIHCELYEHLNQKMPEVFNLDIKVNQYGCCTANTEIGRSPTANALKEKDQY